MEIKIHVPFCFENTILQIQGGIFCIEGSVSKSGYRQK